MTETRFRFAVHLLLLIAAIAAALGAMIGARDENAAGSDLRLRYAVYQWQC
jgi:cytochrome c biogenesis protein ResB